MCKGRAYSRSSLSFSEIIEGENKGPEALQTPCRALEGGSLTITPQFLVLFVAFVVPSELVDCHEKLSKEEKIWASNLPTS